MTLGLLLADTLRSRAYVQALAHAGIRPDLAMVIQSPNGARWGHTDDVIDTGSGIPGVFMPDLNRPLLEDVHASAGKTEVTTAGTVNDPTVVSWIADHRPDLVVFSGFGGEIVRDPVIGAGSPLLHLHSGWLPDYRGSTTLYYSYLVERRCGVSAILLEREIDTGPIVARQWYPPPAPDLDVDYLYDAAIRADLLVGVVRSWLQNTGSFVELTEQPQQGRTYYIIHPVLKHLALNDLKNQ